MTRIAHLADLHLGRRAFHRMGPGGRNQRELDVQATAERAVAAVIDAQPDAVLVAGDLFDSPRPTNLVIREALGLFQTLRAGLPGAPIVLIEGNHDDTHVSDAGSILPALELLGVDAVIGAPRLLVYASLDLAIQAIPHPALRRSTPLRLIRSGEAAHELLLMHGAVRRKRSGRRPALPLPESALSGGWDYIALGDYHVQHEVVPGAWYSGSLDFVSTDPWSELRDEARLGGPGRGWLLADLATGVVHRHAAAPARPYVELPTLDARGFAAGDLSGAILAAIPQDHAGQVIRQRVLHVSRETEAGLDHRAIRKVRAMALDYQLVCLRPEVSAETVEAEGRDLALAMTTGLAEALRRGTDLSGVDLEGFLRRGNELYDEVSAVDPADSGVAA